MMEQGLQLSQEEISLALAPIAPAQGIELAASQLQQQNVFSTWSSQSQHLDLFDSEERAILRARYQHPRICDIGVDVFATNQFKLRVMYWCQLVGVRMPPDAMQMTLISRYLAKRVNGLTFPEIDEALEQDVIGDDRTEHFQQFDLKFLSSVLNKYQKKRQLAEKKYRESLAKLPKPKALPPAQSEVDCMAANHLLEMYYEFLEASDGQRDYQPVGGTVAYQVAVRLELLAVTEEEFEQACLERQKHYEFVISNRTTGRSDAKAVGQLLGDEFRLKNRAQSDARDALLLNWFHQMRVSDVDFWAFRSSVIAQLNAKHGLQLDDAPVAGGHQ